MKLNYFIDQHKNLYVFGKKPDDFYTAGLIPKKKIPKKIGSYIYFENDEIQANFTKKQHRR